MKKFTLVLILSLFFAGMPQAQIPDEAFPLINSMYDLWDKGEIDKAIESSIELYGLYPPFFIDVIHNTLGQMLEGDTKQYGYKYLEQLYGKGNKEINEIIAPVYLWARVLNVEDSRQLETIKKDFSELLNDCSNYQSRTGRYGLLIVKELDKKKAINDLAHEKYVRQIISSLGKCPLIDVTVSNGKEAEKRAWHRYLLAYSYNYLYSNLNKEEEYLKLAAQYSPDLSDRLNRSAYFYDAALLTGDTKKIGYKLKYQKHLAENNRNGESLNLLSDITFAEPSDKNLRLLENFFAKTNSSNDFSKYWQDFIHSKGKKLPEVKVDFGEEELDLTQKPGHWIYIDVWGTWCSPCRKELPELQSFYVENKSDVNSRLRIYTFSFASQELNEFMSKNNYTFPVSEIDQQTNDLFEISSYPTKILITPEGHYFKIPFGVNWKGFIKNYLLLNQ